MRNVALALVVLCVAATAPRMAEAQSVDGRLRLHLAIAPMQFRSVTDDIDGRDSDTESSTSAGLTGNEWVFLSGPVAGVGIGYGLSPNFVLGGNLHFQIQDDPDRARFQLGPYAHYVFDLGSFAAPFVGGRLGMSHEAFDDLDNSVTLFRMGAEGGVHLFLAEGVSLDPMLLFEFFAGGGSVGDRDRSMNGFSFSILVELSGWV